MVYTEVQIKDGKKYFYRAMSIRKNGKVAKVRKYLGVDLDKQRLKKAEKVADEILQHSLNKILTLKEQRELQKIKKEYQNQSSSNWENRYEAFLAQFTYDSNAIEGNTLTLEETSFILFENRTPEGKSLREVNEVLNHKEAFDLVLSHKGYISKLFICAIQKIIVKNTLRPDLENQIGNYRNIQVYMRGANFVPPKPKEAKTEMRNLLAWYTRNKNKLHPLVLAAHFHAAFESIHPFVDGNGRTGRLLMNFILHKSGYPMINIPNKRRLEYYDCLDEARKGNLRKFVKFLFDLLVESGIYV